MTGTERIKAQIARLGIRSIGRLSDGLRLCLDEGLTAGKTVDYVYRNKPSGRFWIGKKFDQWYLSHPDWAALRQRRANLERLLVDAVEDVRASGRPVEILDIASGPGLYILSVLEADGGSDLHAVCSDFEARWITEGAAEASRRGLTNVSYEEGDAFDRDRMLARKPRPNIIVASGFYDWFAEDDAVRESLGIVADVLEDGDLFVLTFQTSHPDLEFVSMVFEDHRHEPLRMKMRPFDHMSRLLGEVGFRVDRSLVDDQDYYSAVMARKTSGE